MSAEDAGVDVAREASIDAGVVSDAPSVADAQDTGTCTPATCNAPGSSCVNGACVQDCRNASAAACGAGTICDFVDGQCRVANSCSITGAFAACDEGTCGPGSECGPDNRCVADGRCRSVQCDGPRCFGVDCACERPAPRCSPVSLARLNGADFVGAMPTNSRPDEGIIDLEFDSVCSAYAVTVISGQDHLRQLTSDGMFTSWGGASNIDMGEVAIRARLGSAAVETELGEVALTYACISGCTATTEDAQQGLVRLDRMSATRPLPNVVPAMITRGSGPFGNATIDAGPAGLAYGPDGRLYIGNLDANGEFYQVELATRTRTLIHRFTSRVNASAVFDSRRVLVALENREVYLLPTTPMAVPVRWAMLEGTVTSLARDRFTGRVYAELRVGAEPRIVEISADGMTVRPFQRPARLGRIAIAPDNYLYHTAVFPNVQWTNVMSPPIERWPLPATR